MRHGSHVRRFCVPAGSVVLLDLSNVEMLTMKRTNVAKELQRKSYAKLSGSARRNIRSKLLDILRKRGPIVLADIKRHFHASTQQHLSTFLRALVSEMRVWKNDEGGFYVSEFLDGAESLPFAGSAERTVDGIGCSLPTDYGPGSEGKVRVLQARYFSGIPLWNHEDNKVCTVPCPTQAQRGSVFHEYEPEPDFEDAEIL